MRFELIERIEEAFADVWEGTDGDLDCLQLLTAYSTWLVNDMSREWLEQQSESYLEALLGEMEDVLESMAELNW